MRSNTGRVTLATSLAVVAAVGAARCASAAAFANGSFETPTPGNPGSYNGEAGVDWFQPNTFLTGADGWIARASSFADNPGASGGVLIDDDVSINGPASDGDQFFGLASHNRPGSVEQTFDTIPGTLYEVTWDHAYLTPGPPVPHTADYFVTAAASSAEYTVTAGTSQPFATTNFAPATAFTFLATSTSTTLKFEAEQAYGNSYYGAAIDNVVVTAIPEPAAASLLAVAGGTLVRRRVRGR